MANDRDTIARLFQNVTAEQEFRLLKAMDENKRVRLKMISTMAFYARQPWLSRTLIDIEAIVAMFDLPAQPCEYCRGPLLHGDGVTCEWCGSKLPEKHPQGEGDGT